jgi:hypothetical protein
VALSPPARQLLVTLMLSAADAAACVLRRYNNVVSVAWNAYLSTLSHDAVLDTSQLLDLFDNAEDMLNSWVSLQTGTRAAACSAACHMCAAYRHSCTWSQVGSTSPLCMVEAMQQ